MIDRRMIPQLGCEISRLGYGGMRFPKNGDEVDVVGMVELPITLIPLWFTIKENLKRFSAKHLKSTIAAATIWQTK